MNKWYQVIWKVPQGIVLAVGFAICGFAGGLYFPWDDCVNGIVNPGPQPRYDSFKWYSIPGRVLGMIVCSVLFAIGAGAYGLIYPWLDNVST